MSLFVKIFLIVYMGTLFHRFWYLGDPNNYIISQLVKVDKLGAVKMNTTRLKPFWVLKKQKEGGPLWLNRPDLEKYIDIFVIQENADWY